MQGGGINSNKKLRESIVIDRLFWWHWFGICSYFWNGTRFRVWYIYPLQCSWEGERLSITVRWIFRDIVVERPLQCTVTKPYGTEPIKFCRRVTSHSHAVKDPAEAHHFGQAKSLFCPCSARERPGQSFRFFTLLMSASSGNCFRETGRNSTNFS